EKVGADVMRWLFSRHNPSQNLNFGYGLASETKRTLLTLWNVYSFFVTYANIDDFSPEGRTIDDKQFTKLDRWIRSRITSLICECDDYYARFDTTSVVKAAEEFFDDLSNWYVRRNRRRYWKSESDDDKVTAYLVLYDCLVKLIKLISPIMPFLTEDMYQNLVRQTDTGAPDSIHLCDFPESDKSLIDEELEREVALTRSVVSLGRAARNKVNIKIRQPLSEIVVDMPKDDTTLSDADKEIILEELNIKKFGIVGKNALADVFSYSAVPLFDKLGPKFGKDGNKVGSWIKSLGDEEIQKLLQFNFLKKEIEGKMYEIDGEDVEVKKIERAGWSVAIEDEYGVGINTEITKTLENEGLVRELIHRIQLMRKEADFNLVDRIKIFYKAAPKLRDAIHDNLDYLKSETLAVDVSEGSSPGDVRQTLNINGMETEIVLQKISNV
ncbi:MAG: class I tRNA ligase family protein, partial [candidate division WOR-3 bacterium]